MNTVQAANGKWLGILAEFGIEREFLQNKHGPCPLCGGKDRFRFDNKNGGGSYYCAGCGPGDGMSLAMKFTGKSFAETAKEIDKMIDHVARVESIPTRKDPAILLNKIYSGSQAPKGTLVEKYLSGRGLELPESDVLFNPSVGYYEDGRYVCSLPAMISVFRDPQRVPNTMHITYLSQDGKKASVKAPKKIMTPKTQMAGGSVQLCAPGSDLGIAEGIETALAASQLDDLPVWAALNSKMLEKFEPPEGVETVHIYADADMNYAGQSAAYKLAHTLSLKGFKALVIVPEGYGDWNDVLLARMEMYGAVSGGN